MITLTDKASVKVKELIDAEGDEGLALRVAVRPGGCSGFAYEMFFDTEVAEDEGVEVCPIYGDTFDEDVQSYVELIRANARSLQRCLTP